MTSLLALIIAILVMVPWFLAGRTGQGIAAGAITFVLSFLTVFWSLPNTAGPLGGEVGIIAAVFLFLVGMISFFDSDGEARRLVPFWIGLAVAIIFLGTNIFTSKVFRARDYASLVPPIELREWKSDFQPKDPKHFRVSSDENARFLAARAIGQATTLDSKGQPSGIGSQFSVEDEVSSVQIINGELWTIVPLDWKGWGQQTGTARGVPGYIRVSAENPILPAEYVQLPAGKEFRYTPESTFDDNLNRLVWRNNMGHNIADIHLEIDDDGNPHYIVSLSKPTIGWSGEKIVGALIVDPVTGAGVDKVIPLGEIPHWVDRVEAKHIVHNNIDYHGKYSGGWLNRSLQGVNVLAATETHFGYGSDGEPVFATGITAHASGSKADSLVAVYYTNTRTGKTVEYRLPGGTTEQRAMEQCNLIGDVRNKGYHATTPQLYNVYGHISYVVPLQNSSKAFAGVAIVAVMNPQIIAWGASAHEAELAFKQVIVSNSSQMAIDSTHKLAEITGEVERMGSILVSGSTTYFIQVKGMKHLFTVPLTASNKIPVTKIGDRVWVEYFDSGEEVMPINKFDNKSIQLEASALERAVHDRATTDIDKSRAKGEERNDVATALDKLSPADRALIEAKMRKN